VLVDSTRFFLLNKLFSDFMGLLTNFCSDPFFDEYRSFEGWDLGSPALSFCVLFSRGCLGVCLLCDKIVFCAVPLCDRSL